MRPIILCNLSCLLFSWPVSIFVCQQKCLLRHAGSQCACATPAAPFPLQMVLYLALVLTCIMQHACSKHVIPQRTDAVNWSCKSQWVISCYQRCPSICTTASLSRFQQIVMTQVIDPKASTHGMVDTFGSITDVLIGLSTVSSVASTFQSSIANVQAPPRQAEVPEGASTLLGETMGMIQNAHRQDQSEISGRIGWNRPPPTRNSACSYLVQRKRR